MFDQETMLRHHLQYNHYPPIHPSFVPIAQEAINKANAEDWDSMIAMPYGIKRTVAEIVELMHLEWFLENGEPTEE